LGWRFPQPNDPNASGCFFLFKKYASKDALDPCLHRNSRVHGSVVGNDVWLQLPFQPCTRAKLDPEAAKGTFPKFTPMKQNRKSAQSNRTQKFCAVKTDDSTEARHTHTHIQIFKNGVG